MAKAGVTLIDDEKTYLAGALGACLTFHVGTALADDSSRRDPARDHPSHLLQAELHGGPAVLGGDVDGHYPQNGVFWGIGAGYSYALPGVDLGGTFDYMTVPDRLNGRNSFVLAVVARPHLSLSETVELGVAVRVGWVWTQILHLSEERGGKANHTFAGLHLGVAPDLRLWLTEQFAIDLGVELLAVGGHDSSDAKATYFERDAGMAALGAFLRANWGL